MEEEPEYRERFQKIKDAWERHPSVASGTSFLFDSDSSLERVWNRIKEEESGSSGLNFDRQSSIPESKVPNHSIVGQSQQFQKRMVARKHGIGGLYRQKRWVIAASVLFVSILLTSFVVYLYWEEPSHSVYATSSVEQHIITLPDESVVRLNRNSSIELLFDQEDGSRDVRLKGEAYFEVEHDPDRPFSVRVGDSEVRVHGTAFNVKEKDGVMVAVQEGVVSVHHERLNINRGVRLTAGQLGILTPGGDELRIEDGALENYLAWMNGYLSFDDMPFPQVVQQLERIFGIESVLVDPGLQDIRLSVYTNRMQASEVLHTIALTLDLTYERDGNEIRWKFEEN
ncbi:MAG: FecR family protein [Bacteroidota bacterium]